MDVYPGITYSEPRVFYHDGDGRRVKEGYWGGTETTTRLFLFGASMVVADHGGAEEAITRYYRDSSNAGAEREADGESDAVRPSSPRQFHSD